MTDQFSLFRHSLTVLFTRISAAAFTVIGSIITARVLGPSGRGEYTLIVLMPTLLVSLGNLGVGTSSIYFLGKKRHSVSRVVGNAIVLAFVIGAILVACALSWVYIAKPTFLRSVNVAYVVLAVSTVPVWLFYTNLMWILLGINKVKDYNLAFLTRPFFLIVALFFFVVLLRMHTLGATFSYAIAVIVAGVIAAFLVHRIVHLNFGFDLKSVEEILKFGVKSHLGAIALFLNYRLSFFLVGHFLPLSSVGYYSISVAVVETLWYIPTAVSLVLLPKISSSSIPEANRVTPLFSRNVFLLTIFFGLLYGVFAKFAVAVVYGQSYEPSIMPLLILLPGIVVFSIPKIVSSDFTGRGRPLLNAYVAFTSLGLNGFLGVMLIPKYGVSGAALATTSAYFVSSLMTLLLFTKISSKSLRDMLIPKVDDLELYRTLFLKVKRRFRWCDV